ncbi:discoidin domain-containing protein [Cohnella ginsengisoli]|uniref:discoidin domain-containing protein n=1 Tax=Cohnella ginsengisoli TaxID=425004 RepID=UPI0030B88F48
MAELGRVLSATFSRNLASGAYASATEEADDLYAAGRILDGSADTYWRPREGTEQASIVVELPQEATFDTIVLQEHIQSGQRIEQFRIEAEREGRWQPLYRHTVVGYKRICRFPETAAKRLRLTIEASRWCPTLSAFEVYRSTKN